MTQPNAFYITAENAEPVAHPLTLEAMQQSVGGYICPAFTVDGPDGHSLTGYVDDEGAINGATLTAILDNGTPLFGPLLITGLDGGGETVPLTPTDMDWIEERLTLVLLASSDRETIDACWRLTLRD